MGSEMCIRDRKISVNGVILISVKRASFPLLVLIPILFIQLTGLRKPPFVYFCLLNYFCITWFIRLVCSDNLGICFVYSDMFAFEGVVDSSFESTKLKNNNLISWKSSS